MNEDHDPWDLAACILSVANRGGPQQEIDGFREDLEIAVFGQLTGALEGPVNRSVALWNEGNYESAKLIMTYICSVMGPIRPPPTA